MIYIYEISERNRDFESILFDWLKKNKDLDSIEYFNMSSRIMRENYLVDFLYDLFAEDCNIENEIEKDEYIYDLIREKTIKEALVILLTHYKIRYIKLLIVEEDLISNVSELVIRSL